MTVGEALDLVQIPEGMMRAVQSAQSVEESRTALVTMQAQVKANRKRLALQHHPDLGGDVEKLKVINAAADGLLRLQLVLRPRPQPVVHVHIMYGFTSSATSASSTTTTTAGGATGDWW